MIECHGTSCMHFTQIWRLSLLSEWESVQIPYSYALAGSGRLAAADAKTYCADARLGPGPLLGHSEWRHTEKPGCVAQGRTRRAAMFVAYTAFPLCLAGQARLAALRVQLVFHPIPSSALSWEIIHPRTRAAIRHPRFAHHRFLAFCCSTAWSLRAFIEQLRHTTPPEAPPRPS